MQHQERAFQDFYPDFWNHCYGCGQLNEHGIKVRSFWDGDETVATVVPRPEHTAIPGYVYGGYILSVIDCHSTGSAAGASYRAAGREMGTEPAFRFLTASLKVDFLKPTPMGVPLNLRSQIKEVKGRKVIVATSLTANGVECARGEAVLVQVPEHLFPEGR